MITFLTRKSTSSLALAIALATGGAVVTTAVMPTEAAAKRKRDRGNSESDGGGYSDEFRAVYVPLDEAFKAEGADVAALRPQIDALIPTVNTNDEKIAAGGLIYNAGARLSDRALQLTGMEMMLASGKVPVDSLGRYNFIGYQLADAEGQHAKSRHYLQAAIDNNFTTETVTTADLRIAMAESFFAGGENAAGYSYLTDAIRTREAQGSVAEERWYRRGVTYAYENRSFPEVYDFANMWVAAYPTADNWRDAINITRNLNSLEGNEILDLFRLGRALGALKDEADYEYYVEAADARRLPKEVKDVIEEGRAKGAISSTNSFIEESLEMANSRIASDRADLPVLERDANAGNAGIRTVMAAANAFLSYDEHAKAAGFFARALGMAGVDASEANLRLGIAKLSMSDYDAARAAFGQVAGKRAPIAQLWTTYANQAEAAANAAAQPVAAPAPAEMPAG